MKVISNAGLLPRRYKNIVAAIGVFDGVHRGHQKVIGRAIQEARRIKGTSVVVTFYPHPVQVLRPGTFTAYFCSLEHRLRLIEALGADVCYVIPFTRAFARKSAADFLNQFLIARLRVKKIVVGEDFHFGKQRQGSADFFVRSGLSVENVPILKIKNINIKTKIIKGLVSEGDLPRLKIFLGRDYGVLADVERGKGIGRRLGFPTANLVRENVTTLPSGIYAARVFAGRKKFRGVCYIGTRPTVKKHRGTLAREVHLLDFQGSLYGKKIAVEFLKKLRDDRAFPDEKTLAFAIARDVQHAREFFKKHPA